MPTLRVRFVYGMLQLLSKEIAHWLGRSPSLMLRNVEGAEQAVGSDLVGTRGNHL